MNMIEIRSRTEGLDGLAAELIDETLESAERQVGQAAALLGKAMKRLLASRRGPSKPGEPPAREADWLWKGIGWEKPKVDRDKGEVTSRVGLGFGRGYRALQKAKAEGINPFDYAWLLEYGGISGKKRDVRIEPRPWARPAEAMVENEAVRILTIH